MPFDVQRFTSARWEPRTERVPVPDLAEWFGEDEEAVFVVRGLSGPELGRCTEAVTRNRDRAALAEGLLSADDGERIQALRETLGVGTAVPDDIAKRLEMLELGSVEPKMDHGSVVKFCEAFPVEFYQLTTIILRLTGRGHQPGKPVRSTKSQTSKTA